jgi:hypothetical protein
MPPKRKSVKRHLADLRAAQAARVIKWIPCPAWTTPANVVYLWAGQWQADPAMQAVTRKQYLDALAVHAPEVLEADQGEASWQLFQDHVYCRGEFAPRLPAPPAPKPSAPQDELDEPGLDHRHPRNAERERTLDRDEGTSEWPAAK